MEKLSFDILDEDFIKVFEPIHWVQYFAGFHRVKIQHKYVTGTTLYYKFYSCVMWALNIIAIVFFEVNCEVKLKGTANVNAYKTCELVVIILNTTVILRNNFFNDTMNSQLYVKLQKIDRVFKANQAAKWNRILFFLSAASAALVLIVWPSTVVILNIILMETLCPPILFSQCLLSVIYLDVMLAAFILMFLGTRLHFINVALEKEVTRLRDASMSLAVNGQYRDKEQDHDKFVAAIHCIVDCWSDCIQLFQFTVISYTCISLVYNYLLMLGIVTAIRDKNVDHLYMLTIGIISVLEISSIVLLSFIASLVTSQMSQTRSICFKALAVNLEIEDKLQKSAGNILMILGTRPDFSIYGIYTVDSQLPLRIFVIIASYTIVLLQFATL